MVASWDDLARQSPLAQADWSRLFQEQVPTTGWWSETAAPFSYGPEMNLGASFDYDPGGFGTTYSPTSSLTMQMIDSDIETWLRREHPELFDFTTGVQYGGVAGVGQVAQDPNFGQFSQDPSVYGEIQAAANKYGVPANFLQAIIAKESSGDWFGNSRPVAVASRGGKRIHGYVGVFEDAAASWGFNFDALTGNRAGQIEMLASGLRGMYDQLRARDPSYGWLNVAAMHYSGDPDARYTPGDSFQHGTTQQYMAEVETWWKQLDAQAGNTWSNYTDVSQNTGIGSPQNAQWGQYAQWDEALVGVSANTGAPANLLKAMLRYGDEQGYGYSSAFDQAFVPNVAQAVADNFARYGDWDTAIAATLGFEQVNGSVTNNPGFRRVKEYWDELNADMSGVFGGQPTGTSPSTQAEAIWGGLPYGVSQEHASTGFANLHPDWYEYSLDVVGYLSHPGADVTLPEGTSLYAPVAGTVIRAGNTGSYVYGNGDSASSGELRIRLDNGHELILGHTKNILVNVGDRVSPGQQVAISGWAGTGDHLHLEYRIPDQTKNGGWAAIDPFDALAGNFTGFHQGARTGLGYTQPLTFQALMRAGASGQPIPSGPVYAQGGGRSAWTTWLRNEMLGIGNPDTVGSRIDYANIYNLGSPGSGRTGSVYSPVGAATANVVLKEAQKYVGVQYVWGAIPGRGDNPWDTGWDCSGFTYWLDQNYGNGSLPMGSHYQYDWGIRRGAITRDTSQLMAGDLVFFDTGSRSGGGAELNGASHVGVYLGGGKMLHAANPNTGTIISNFNEYTGMYPYLGSMHMAWSGA